MRFRALFTAGIATAGALLVAAPVEDTSVAAPDAVKFGPLYPVCKVDGGPSRATGMVIRRKSLYVLGDEMLWIYDISTPYWRSATKQTGPAASTPVASSTVSKRESCFGAVGSATSTR